MKAVIKQYFPRGKSLKVVAQELDIPKATFYGIISGHFGLTVQNAKKIRDYLRGLGINISLDDIFSDENIVGE